MTKQQRKIEEPEIDRFLLTTSKEMGNKIRIVADRKGLTLSNLLSQIVEPVIDKLYDQKEKTVSIELDEFQTFVRSQLKLTDTADMLNRVSEMSEQSRDDLYHILCDRACINTDSADAKIAWRSILEGGNNK